MEVVVELGVPGASEGVVGSEGGRLIRVGGPVDMMFSVYGGIYVGDAKQRVESKVKCLSNKV
jgi:hypothetical protein